MIYDLPKTVEISGTVYDIRSDYRAVLDIISAISDPELTNDEKAKVILEIFYKSFEELPTENYQEAIQRFFWFMNCGNVEQAGKGTKLMDWEQDFQLIASPVNRVLGVEIRSIEYLHWWTFISAYQEIGDCLFAQVVSIRQKKAKGKKLDKAEQEFYRKNRQLVEFKFKYTAEDDAIIDAWLGKKKTAP